MSLADLLVGRPLKSSEERGEKLGPAAGIAVFGLDALSSAAYGPEAALTLLIPLGAAGITYIIPISASIIILLLIVYFSYCQTIEAYPTGGGSYTVARKNLGVSAGLLAAAALMIDYVLTAAVGISAGVGALSGSVPAATHAAAMHGNLAGHHCCESTWRSRDGRTVHVSNLSFRCNYVHYVGSGTARVACRTR
jgi:amino acid transporter